MPYVKLDTGILQSTIWFERDVRELFITALLMAEPHETQEPLPQLKVDAIETTGFNVPPGWYGFVHAAGIGIIRQAGMERKAGMKALAALGNPDTESRSSDYEGRRLVRVDGGYIVLNYIKYRERDSTTADRSRRWRLRQKELKTSRSDTMSQRRDATLIDSTTVVQRRDATLIDSTAVVQRRDTTQAEAEAKAEAEAEAEAEVQDQNQSILVSSAPSTTKAADDTEFNQIIQAFEQSPVTRGRTTKTDRQTARRLLGKYAVVQITNGILLATCRKIGSDLQNGGRDIVKNLAYFEAAIEEAAADENISENYIEHSVRRFIGKHVAEWKARG
jgi:hypothetical protein